MSVIVEKLSASYGEHRVLHDVNFEARSGEVLSVLGPNGVGKSTMFRCILGLMSDYTGKCLVSGEDTKTLNVKKLAQLVSYIPQSHYPAFNYSVFDMVLMGTTAQVGGVSSPKKEHIEKAECALTLLGVADLKNRGYTNISGGERQLVLIARAIAQDARVLIMDEPTSNLDYGNRIRVLSCIRSLARDGYTVVLSTHNPEDAFRYADSVLALYGGAVAALGKPAEVIDEELINKLYAVKVNIIKPENSPPICVPVED